MSPLRGKRPGHKPYRLYIEESPSLAFPDGRKHTKSYHWSKPWHDDIEYARRRKWVYRAWKAATS